MSYTLGQVVGIVRTGICTNVSQGKYTVTKLNKVSIELTRTSDQYVRKFSVKTGKEFGLCSSAFIVSEQDYDSLLVIEQGRKVRLQATADIRTAVEGIGRNGITTDQVAKIRALLDQVEKSALKS
jgi:hypothetical protein